MSLDGMLDPGSNMAGQALQTARCLCRRAGQDRNPIWRKWRSVESASVRRSARMTTKLVQSVKENFHSS
jgi:hypothetical protein